MICKLCKGSGSLVCSDHTGQLLWWPCVSCGATGVTIQHGPTLIGPGTRKRIP